MKNRVRSRIIATSILAAAIATGLSIKGIKLRAANSAANAAQNRALGDDRLVVHEWGTFTSIAGKDGIALGGDRSTDRPTCQSLSTRWGTRTMAAPHCKQT